MILVNRIYTVLSTITLILVTIFYLIYISKYENKEYLLYIQNNSRYSLQNSTQYRELTVFDERSLTYNIPIGKVYLDSYEGYTNSGRFILVFSQPENIKFRVMTNNGENIAKYESQTITPYYPYYVNFHAPKGTKYITLDYSTPSSNIILYKLSIEFF